MVGFSVPSLAVHRESRVRMELRSATGATLFASEHKGSDFPKHASVLLSNRGRPLASGKYTLTIAEKPRAVRLNHQSYVTLPDTLVYPIELRTTDR